MTLFTKQYMDTLILFVLYKSIKSDRKTAKKRINNLINGNIKGFNQVALFM